MTPAEKRYIVEVLEAQAGRARVLARLYEDAAETVAGFTSEAEYQAYAAEAFSTEQELRDMDLTCRYDAEIADAREMAR